MAKNEKTFWEELRRDLKLHIPEGLIQKTADRVFPGIPDVFVADVLGTFWVELKWTTACELTANQLRWLQTMAEIHKLGRLAPPAIVLVGFPEEALLYSPLEIKQHGPFKKWGCDSFARINKVSGHWEVERLFSHVEREI